ncbi:MAG: helix-turn-helix domain-containing protein [Deltaproteobacteria bacterium]|nr:MAG: helix-turn-helix domain-containing protein [Deltaproteobacteria bacterium]
MGFGGLAVLHIETKYIRPKIIGNMDIASTLRNARKLFGLSQAELCHEAGISLATLQNIESGRANPSLGTLRRILDVLGMDIVPTAEGADWDVLAEHGLPLEGGAGSQARQAPELLRHHIVRAIVELNLAGGTHRLERERESVVALLLALRCAYPDTFNEWFGKSEAARKLLPDNPSGRVIKLKRIAERRLSEYL